MIRVSDITSYIKCPRICYFLSRGHELVMDTTTEYLQRLLIKELALTYGSAVNREDGFSVLNCELDRISSEIRTIYRAELAGVDEGTLANAVSCVQSRLADICSNLSAHGDFYASTFEVEPLLYSEKSGLSGSPDKLIETDGTFIPSIIKTGDMPENGVWRTDRLQLAAYAILVEEKYNSVVEYGFVEYARLGKAREVTIKRHERRKVPQIRDRIKKIQDGFMPERPEDAPCERCGFTGICEVKSTLASKFF